MQKLIRADKATKQMTYERAEFITTGDETALSVHKAKWASSMGDSCGSN
jgi:hypothetical protein